MSPFWANAAAGACLLIALGYASAAWPEEGDSPTLELDGMTFVASEGNRNEVVLAAEHARVETLGKLAYLQTVHAVLAPDGDTAGLNMKCERGTIELETSDFVALGNVRGKTGDGRHFRTERMHYTHATGLVSTDSPVLIKDDTGTYRGGGFRYYIRENRFQLRGARTVVQQ